jgi:hypothetical protein
MKVNPKKMEIDMQQKNDRWCCEVMMVLLA